MCHCCACIMVCVISSEWLSPAQWQEFSLFVFPAPRSFNLPFRLFHIPHTHEPFHSSATKISILCFRIVQNIQKIRNNRKVCGLWIEGGSYGIPTSPKGAGVYVGNLQLITSEYLCFVRSVMQKHQTRFVIGGIIKNVVEKLSNIMLKL